MKRETVQVIVAAPNGRELGWTVCERHEVEAERKLAEKQGYRFVRVVA